ncbi:MAG: Foldase protein PrsA precursor [Parcubacteria bacterium C7867-006]|nr:MAG: Foldase protein PrsA precursor [Parcubacteria bacterium C7867-006]
MNTLSKEKIVAVVVVLVVIFGAVGYKMYSKPKAEVAVAPVVETVAKVNGVDITKSAYESQLASVISTLKSQGVNTDTELPKIKAQVLNDLIGNELLNQAVKASGVTATADEVQKQVDALIAQVGGADKFAAELTKANLTEAQLRENVSKQLTIQKYLLSKIDISTATATDAEVSKYYNDNVKGQQGAPALKDIKEQIKQQIINTKQQQLIAAFIESLKATAKIETTVQ